jgi:hypothetical protein
MFSEFFEIISINDRKERGYNIIEKIFNIKDAKKSICNLRRPFNKIVSKLYEDYMKKLIDDKQYVRHLKRQKERYDKYLEAFNYIYLRFCEEKRIEPKMNRIDEFYEEINDSYGIIIKDYVRNSEYTMDNVKEDYMKLLKFVKMDRRRAMVRSILNNMIEHDDFQFFPNTVENYFAFFLNRYITDENYTLPELMHDLEKKYHQIIKVVKRHRSNTELILN